MSSDLDSQNENTLANAAKKDQSDLIKTLVEKGADINIKDDGKLPLHMLSEHDNISAINSLIENGVDINEKNLSTPNQDESAENSLDQFKDSLQKSLSAKLGDTGVLGYLNNNPPTFKLNDIFKNNDQPSDNQDSSFSNK